MYLKRIIISDFKNIREAELEFSPRVNSISGNNGEGKTNLLDAIYYLSMTKSYFNSSDVYTFPYGKNRSALNGTYITGDSAAEERISLGIQSDSGKIVKRNGKTYERISEHIGLIPIVMVSPSDTQLVNGGAEERRKFINSLLSQTDKEYLYRIQRYNQLLAQRNRLLKQPEMTADLLQTITERMSPDALYIYNRRAELSTDMKKIAGEYYAALCGSNESVSLEYTSDLREYAQFGDEALCRLLGEAAQRDAILKYTTAGIHRDDIEFSIMGHPLKRCGSQGQQKSFLIALKLAQFTLMKRLHSVEPILLLDDVFDKLDMQRVEYLLKLVSGEGFGQIFITESNKVRLERLSAAISSDIKFFEVKGGVLQELERL